MWLSYQMRDTHYCVTRAACVIGFMWLSYQMRDIHYCVTRAV
jgi:hypothetical protein